MGHKLLINIEHVVFIQNTTHLVDSSTAVFASLVKMGDQKMSNRKTTKAALVAEQVSSALEHLKPSARTKHGSALMAAARTDALVSSR